MLEYQGDRLRPLATLGEKGPCHTIGNLVQRRIRKLVVPRLDRQPVGVTEHLLLEPLRDRLFRLFLVEPDESVGRMNPTGLFGVPKIGGKTGKVVVHHRRYLPTSVTVSMDCALHSS